MKTTSCASICHDGEVDDLALTVEELRAGMLARRRALPTGVVARHSALVVERLRNLPEVETAASVGAYLGVRGEVDLGGLFGPGLPDEAPAGGVVPGRVALPVTTPGKALQFVVPAGPLVEGPFGILQPAISPEGGDALDPMDLDVVLVPSVVVDPRGNRIGHGAGFYDRTFAAVSEARHSGTPGSRIPLLVGVCHDFQVVADIEARPWDVPLDLIVTEVGLIRP